MEYGYVYKMADNMFGILTYLDKPTVLCRITKANTVSGAVQELTRQFAGNFGVADPNQERWAKVIQAVDHSLLLTDIP